MSIAISKERSTLFVLALATLWFTAYGAQTPETSTDLMLFEQAGMIAEADLNDAVAAGEIGMQAEEAVVPLYFDQDGNLLDAETYNRLIDEGALEQTVSQTTFTDFGTYKKVMQEKARLGLSHQALEDIDLNYVMTMPSHVVSSFTAEADDAQTLPSPEEINQIVYLYDAYSTSYATEEEIAQEIEEQLQSEPLPPVPLDAPEDSPDPLAPPDSDPD